MLLYVFMVLSCFRRQNTRFRTGIPGVEWDILRVEQDVSRANEDVSRVGFVSLDLREFFSEDVLRVRIKDRRFIFRAET